MVANGLGKQYVGKQSETLQCKSLFKCDYQMSALVSYCTLRVGFLTSGAICEGVPTPAVIGL